MFNALLVLRIAQGDIQRVSLPDGQMTEFLAEAGPWPDGIVVAGETVYWTTMGEPVRIPGVEGEGGADFSAATGGVHAVPLAGGPVRDVVGPGLITTAKQLADDGRGRLYWGDREGCRISSVAMDGDGLHTLISNVPDASGEQECVGVAVDAPRGHLYWTQKGPAKGGKGRIFRAGLELPAGEDADARNDVELLWDGLPEPIDLEIHDGFLYWTDRGAGPTGNTLNRAALPPTGERGAEPEILASGFQEAIGLAVDGEAHRVYVSELGGRILAVELDAPRSAPTLVADLQTPVTGVAGLRAPATSRIENHA
ncbi:hypothetical protein [Arthrobacter sp. NPDC090010]|uniref:hypothetical protein n=1 Tax=Arthrobacter sp. NPDC090010 TaxID=3363942 RepID=UPI00382A0FE1